MIRLDDKKVKSETLALEEEIEGMLLEYEYMDRPIKTGRQITSKTLKMTCLPPNSPKLSPPLTLSPPLLTRMTNSPPSSPSSLKPPYLRMTLYNQMFPTLEEYQNFIDAKLKPWQNTLKFKYFNSMY